MNNVAQKKKKRKNIALLSINHWEKINTPYTAEWCNTK